MKVVLTTLNSKYIHPNIALRILRNDLNNNSIVHQLNEYTIKEDVSKIVDELVNFDIVAISCYIYNIEKVKEIIKCLKQTKPEIVIILGGPEVSFINEDEAQDLVFDYIVSGEGEQIFVELVQALVNDSNIDSPYLISKKKGLLKMNTLVNYISLDYAQKLVNDFSDIDIKNQIVYLETSRGCPYQCSYCQASLDNNVRNFKLDDVYNLIDEVINKQVKLVKFLDRTFNFDVDRTNKIIEYIIKKDLGLTTFQFEITGELLDISSIEIVNNKARKGLFRFEIGIQSTNKQANKAIRRYQDFNKLKSVIQSLQASDKAVLHLDLIAGLPFENLESFKQTFNQVFALKPTELQLGFLKLLKGTALNEIVKQYNYKFDKTAPYQIVSNQFLSIGDLKTIDDVEHGLNHFYNNAKAKNLCNHLIEKYQLVPFELFNELGTKLKTGMQIYQIYQIILDSNLLKDDDDMVVLLRNYYQLNKNRPKSLTKVNDKKKILHELIDKYRLVQNNVFTNACIEQISEDRFFVYLLNTQEYYLIEKER